MKRIIGLLALAAAIGLAVQTVPAIGVGAALEPDVEARAALLMDASTGAVLAGKLEDEPLPPASMSKMMTEVVVLDAVRRGKLAWDDRVVTSRYAACVEGAQIGFGAGEKWTVRELFEAMTVHSANDAAVALAERTAGSEREFVKRMNRKAREIGLSERTVFANATGLSSDDLQPFREAASEGDSVMTARDAARLARYLVHTYPEVLEVTKQRDVALASRKVTLHTTNRMLPGEPFGYKGNDGMKTGYTSDAGYCFTGTVKRGGKRLIAVVMGAPTADARFTETEKLFQFGFDGKGGAAWIARLKSVF